MITREEALRLLDAVANELVALRAALAEGWTETPDVAPTQTFLAKCEGWEDTRSPEEIIAEIYAARTISPQFAVAEVVNLQMPPDAAWHTR
jgi:hypothetical protein